MTGWKDKRKAMQRYDLTAEMYEERYSEEQKAKYTTALENIIVIDGVVLDVGCGSGLFFREIATETNVLVGVDISRKLLLKARDQTTAFQNVLVLQADADHLPFKKAFDAVFAFTVLQNMPNPAETLNELKRVSRLGGKVVVTGLKKVFSLNVFMEILEGSGLKLVSFIDNKDLKCYVAVLTA